MQFMGYDIQAPWYCLWIQDLVELWPRQVCHLFHWRASNRFVKFGHQERNYTYIMTHLIFTFQNEPFKKSCLVNLFVPDFSQVFYEEDPMKCAITCMPPTPGWVRLHRIYSQTIAVTPHCLLKWGNCSNLQLQQFVFSNTVTVAVTTHSLGNFSV